MKTGRNDAGNRYKEYKKNGAKTVAFVVFPVPSVYCGEGEVRNLWTKYINNLEERNIKKLVK